MKKIIALLLILCLVGILGYIFFYKNKLSVASPTKETNAVNQVFDGGTTIDQNSSEKPGGTVVESSVHTNSLSLKEFKNNGVTVKDVVNPGSYILAGDLGYCLGDGSCPKAGSSTEYTIEYDERSNYFTVILLKKPLGASRDLAESFLSKTLGVEAKDLCKLNYFVSTPSFVDDARAGENFGFSNCSKL